MRRKPCPAARKILAELHADKMQAWYDRTHSHRALVALQAARQAAMDA
jgi:hypothetical protein